MEIENDPCIITSTDDVPIQNGDFMISEVIVSFCVTLYGFCGFSHKIRFSATNTFPSPDAPNTSRENPWSQFHADGGVDGIIVAGKDTDAIAIPSKTKTLWVAWDPCHLIHQVVQAL